MRRFSQSITLSAIAFFFSVGFGAFFAVLQMMGVQNELIIQGLVVLVALSFVVGSVGLLLRVGTHILRAFSWIYFRIKTHLRDLSFSATFGLLVAAIERLTSGSSYSAVAVGVAAFAVAQLSFFRGRKWVKKLESHKEAMSTIIDNLTYEKTALEGKCRHMEELRDGQIRRRCQELSRDLKKWLENVKGEDPNEIVRRYDKWYRDRADILRGELKELGWWNPPDDLKRQLEYLRTPDDISEFADYLHLNCELDVFGERN